VKKWMMWGMDIFKEFKKVSIIKWYPMLYVGGTYLKLWRGELKELEVVYFVAGLDKLDIIRTMTTPESKI
jgi:hypothetical protein